MEKVLLNTELYRIEDDDSATFAQLEGHTIGLENGKTYTVTLDSGTYEVECLEIGEDARIIGIEANFTVVESTEDGNAFVFVADYNYGTHIVISTTEPEEPEEPTDPIGFIEYLVNPKYRMGKPFRGIIGWKLAQKVGGGSADGEPALVSSDGYTLQDVNGLNLIPKEGK